jgi:arginyl-tRNA synthetase
VRDKLDQLVRDALRTLSETDGPAELADLDPGLERARDPEHGDFASNVAMRASKLAGKPPRELAQAIIDRLPADPLVAATELAGPGFINFRLTPDAYHATVTEILSAKSTYGTKPAGTAGSVLIEYVSANPTGPLHVGHGRHAAYGASLAAILRAAGCAVDEEYYINDAGRQMDILAASVWLRYAQLHNAVNEFPSNCYQGDYVADIAEQLAAVHRDAFLPAAQAVAATLAEFGNDQEKNLDDLIATLKSELGETDFSVVFNAALDEILGDIRNDLAEFGVEPTRWFSERSLTESNAVSSSLSLLDAKGMLYEKDGPTWFRTTDFGDDKDRVVVRESGVTTYFASDIAYHIDKFKRGHDQLINVLGSDHHGYVARIRAAVEASGNDVDRLDFRLMQFVVLYRGTEKVQMTTRGGSYVTLRELREEVGNDAARFFYVSRSNDQHLEFDLELAKAETSDNPVYYIQYAHARVASMLERLETGRPNVDDTDLDRLSNESEISLMRHLSRYPEIVELAASSRAPQHVVYYLRDLAAIFHAYYNSHRILVDDAGLRDARIVLAIATQQVVRNGLGLLGVTAPEKM